MTPHKRGVAVLIASAAIILAGCTSTPKLVNDTPASEPTEEDLSLGLSEPVSDPMYPDIGYADIDVLHYNLALDYDVAKRVLSGVATLTIRPVSSSDDISLDFSDALKISEITVDGSPATHRQEEWDLHIDSPVTADETVVVAITYSGTPHPIEAPSERSDMSSGIGASIGADGALWTFQEPYGALTWYPVNDHPSDKAMYDFQITVPDGYSGVASGTYLGQEGNTFSWASSDPVASYLTTLAVDRYTMTKYEGPNGLPITVWNTAAYPDLDPILERMPEHIAWLEERYGPYPFDSAGVVVVGGNSAMETQEMVTFSGGYVDMAPPQDVEGVVIHELAHQWFGDTATPLDWTNLWLSEGAATYAEQMWHVDQGTTSDDIVASNWRDYDFGLRQQYGPPGDADPGTFAASNSYMCPALMLFEMRDEIGGADALDELLAAWVAENHNRNVTRADFIAFVNDHTGKDLTAFIDEWLDSPTTPE